MGREGMTELTSQEAGMLKAGKSISLHLAFHKSHVAAVPAMS